VFQVNNNFFWIPVIGPIIGAIIGVWLFEGYTTIVTRFANLSNVMNMDSIELKPGMAGIDDDDDDHGIISHNLTAIRS
jgi:hypothetical protein